MNPPPIARILALHPEKNRRELALLRRWWSPSTRHYAWPVLAKFAGPQAIENLPLALTAALYARHPLHQEKVGNLAATCQKLRGTGKVDDRAPFDARFQRLLSSRRISNSGFQKQLLAAVTLCRSKNLPLNYLQLQDDLHQWHWRGQSVQIRWASYYYQATATEETPAPDPA